MLPVENGQERPVGVIVLGSREVKDNVGDLLNFTHKLYIDGVK
jgi:hypothetical protein